jgi:hypothetical protein
MESQSTALTERATAWSTTRFSALEAGVLGERKLQIGCVLCMSVFKRAGKSASLRNKRCPVTPCVPARRDGR